MRRESGAPLIYVMLIYACIRGDPSFSLGLVHSHSSLHCAAIVSGHRRPGINTSKRESNIRTVVNANRDHRRDKIVPGIVYTFELFARPVKTQLVNCEVLLLEYNSK